MPEQLALELPAAPVERRYTCCDQPCGALGHDPADVYPHAPDCPNPNVGTWIHRETGWVIRRLKCVDDDKPCPTGGVCPPRPGVHDPHAGGCCKTLSGEER